MVKIFPLLLSGLLSLSFVACNQQSGEIKPRPVKKKTQQSGEDAAGDEDIIQNKPGSKKPGGSTSPGDGNTGGTNPGGGTMPGGPSGTGELNPNWDGKSFQGNNAWTLQGA